MTKAHEKITVFVFGVVFVIAMLVLAIVFPEPKPFQYLVFKSILSLAAAGVAAMIPGSLEVNVPNWLKAGGALAVFALVMHKSPADLVVQPPPEPIKGSVILRDGFRFFNQSGYQFSTGSIVAWNAASADILAVTPKGQPTTKLFIPYDAEDYKNPNWDKDAAAGIQRVSGTQLSKVRECPVDGYKHHWFAPEKGGLYCVRTRSGKHFAVIRVDTVDDDRIGFEFIFQPSGSSRF